MLLSNFGDENRLGGGISPSGTSSPDCFNIILNCQIFPPKKECTCKRKSFEESQGWFHIIVPIGPSDRGDRDDPNNRDDRLKFYLLKNDRKLWKPLRQMGPSGRLNLSQNAPGFPQNYFLFLRPPFCFIMLSDPGPNRADRSKRLYGLVVSVFPCKGPFYVIAQRAF